MLLHKLDYYTFGLKLGDLLTLRLFFLILTSGMDSNEETPAYELFFLLEASDPGMVGRDLVWHLADLILVRLRFSDLICSME